MDSTWIQGISTPCSLRIPWLRVISAKIYLFVFLNIHLQKTIAVYFSNNIIIIESKFCFKFMPQAFETPMVSPTLGLFLFCLWTLFDMKVIEAPVSFVKATETSSTLIPWHVSKLLTLSLQIQVGLLLKLALGLSLDPQVRSPEVLGKLLRYRSSLIVGLGCGHMKWSSEMLLIFVWPVSK